MELRQALSRGLAALVHLYKNHRRDRPDSSHDKPERLQLVSEPSQYKNVSEAHQDRRNNNDEEGTIHNFQWHRLQPVRF
jgi:hypothetical protein